MPTMNSR